VRRPVDYIFPPVADGFVPYWRLVLRGFSQLCFQTNELTGVCFFLAALIASPISAAYLLIAGLMAPAGRLLLGQPGPDVATGLPGLNPCLVALLISSLFQTGWTNVGMWVVLIVSVAITIVLVRALLAILPFPILVLPLLIVGWGLYSIEPFLDVLQPGVTISPHSDSFHPVEATILTLSRMVASSTIPSGLLFLAGLMLSNWRHGIVALFGAFIAAIVSYYYREADVTTVNLGLYGINAVLASVAVFVFCGGKLRLALLGALVATILVPAFGALKIPPLAAPFVLTTWLMLVLGWVEQKWFDVPPEPATLEATASASGSSDQSTQSRPGD